MKVDVTSVAIILPPSGRYWRSGPATRLYISSENGIKHSDNINIAAKTRRSRFLSSVTQSVRLELLIVTAVFEVIINEDLFSCKADGQLYLHRPPSSLGFACCPLLYRLVLRK